MLYEVSDLCFSIFFLAGPFFGDGRFVACLITQLKEHHVDSIALPPWEWCDRNRTLTEKQDHVQISFYISKISVFSVFSTILLLALIFQCCARCFARCCARYCGRICNGCYIKSCCRCYIRCCSRHCGGCCCGWCEEKLVSKTEALHSSVLTVYCVKKRIEQPVSKKYRPRVTEAEKVALCSVSDGTTVYLITLKGDQISKLQEGKTYIIENATVKDDHPVPKLSLEKKNSRLFRTAPLQLDEKLIRKAQESIDPSTERAALNDPALYLKKGYITLTGEVVSPIQTDIPVKDITIKEAGDTVTVYLTKKPATVSLETGQKIEISHVKVKKNKIFGKKLMASYYTVISDSEGSHIKVKGYDTDNKVLLTEEWKELSVPSSVWHEDLDQLLQTLPAELKITRWDQKVTKVEKAPFEKSSVYRVHCVVKRTVQRTSKYDFYRDSVRVREREDVALCSVSDGTAVYLITLKGDQISELQEGETYIINNATVKEDRPVPEMILGNETEVFRMDPLQLDEKLMHKAQESINPSSERAALNDPALYLKKGYITLTGEVVSLSAPKWIEGDILAPVRDVEIQEAGVTKTLSLHKDAATVPLETGQMIEITHVKVEENDTQEQKLMSSDYTVISVQQGSRVEERRSLLQHEGLATSDDSNFLSARRDQDLIDMEIFKF
ncbi:uncharacterized protein LOC108416091 isoform X2 [Pygocentrus nattereri]|uniref:uncharacterized protein LOC108416091 isoform X2 n=1 Tax=Pygocentrus nattereri TaxID=42514 RepID=UPI001890C139|nr:uncharacterized protein LOC108416091 isoform X2 [Pygocentrus nattereri]